MKTTQISTGRIPDHPTRVATPVGSLTATVPSLPPTSALFFSLPVNPFVKFLECSISTAPANAACHDASVSRGANTGDTLISDSDSSSNRSRLVIVIIVVLAIVAIVVEVTVTIVINSRGRQ